MELEVLLDETLSDIQKAKEDQKELNILLKFLNLDQINDSLFKNCKMQVDESSNP